MIQYIKDLITKNNNIIMVILFSVYLKLYNENFGYLKIIGPIILISILFLCRKKIKNELLKIIKLGQAIKNKQYFFITEQGHYTDIKNRREFGERILSFFCVGCFLILVTIFPSFEGSRHINSLVSKTILSSFILAFFIHIKNYFTTVQFYLLPILVSLFSLDSFSNLGSSTFALKFLFVITIVYLLFVVLIPFPYLRKIDSTSWLSGALFSFCIPILVDYCLKDRIVYEIEKNIERLKLDKFGDLFFEKYPTLTSVPEFRELINVLVRDHNRLEFLSIEANFSSLTFILLSSYTIGFLIVSLKLNLGYIKAKYLYKELIEIEYPSYELIRQCIYYGDEKNLERIYGNKYYLDVINQIEGKSDLFIKPGNIILKSRLIKEILTDFLIRII